MSAITSSAANRYLTEDPQKNSDTLKCKGWTSWALEKICWVAVIAIMGVVLTIAYTGIPLTGAMPLAVVGLVLATLPIIAGITKFSTWANEFFRRAKEEDQVALESKNISHWKADEIRQFIADEGLDVNQIPALETSLKSINPKEPLCALLPAIARFQYLKKTALSLEEAAKKRFAEANASQGDPNKAEIRFEERRLAWEHRQNAMGTAIDAAMMLRIIQHPFDRLLDVRQPDNTIPCIGECKPKTKFLYDAYHRTYEPNDNYLIFEKDLRRRPLTETEIQVDLNPRTLYRKIFNPEAV